MPSSRNETSAASSGGFGAVMGIKIFDCYIYPLKSGGSIRVENLELTQRGPKDDRLWLLVQDQGPDRGKFITQRDKGCEKLALVQAFPDVGGNMKFSAPGGQELVVSQDELSCYDGFVNVWGDDCAAIDAGNVAAHWFSNYIRKPCRLVKFPDDFIRSTDAAYSRQGDHVSFADGFPLLVTNVASLDKLRKHLPPNIEIEMERFRPNIVLEGAEPFEEDVIREIKIGDVVLEFVRPCSRCKITTISQAEGASTSDEPLRTLGRVRRGKGDGLEGVFFGQNAIPRKLGVIKVGDNVEILSKRPLHPALKNGGIGAQGTIDLPKR